MRNPYKWKWYYGDWRFWTLFKKMDNKTATNIDYIRFFQFLSSPYINDTIELRKEHNTIEVEIRICFTTGIINNIGKYVSNSTISYTAYSFDPRITEIILVLRGENITIEFVKHIQQYWRLKL